MAEAMAPCERSALAFARRKEGGLGWWDLADAACVAVAHGDQELTATALLEIVNWGR